MKTEKTKSTIQKNGPFQDKLIKALKKGLARAARARGEEVFFQIEKEDENTIAIMFTSPLGEDLCFLIDLSLGARAFFEAVQCMFEFFNPDEHVYMWLGKSLNGVPCIPRALELAQDALAIYDLLEIFADDVVTMARRELKALLDNDPRRNEYLGCEAYYKLTKLKPKDYYRKDSKNKMNDTAEG